MSGNVWEWVSSIYRSYPYKAEDGRESTVDTMSGRVLRGGSFGYVENYLRAAYRDRTNPGGELNNIGFRCARS
jgi:formylglycine-generating enzyme required for sulfatase activity